jgi:hypothetical protein
MSRIMGAVLCGAILSVIGVLSARAADPAKPEIRGGIEGKIVSVDADKGTITIASETGSERTFSVTDNTTILGPRGGVVHQRLKDHRFHKGLPITVVGTGGVATELHLGFDRKARAAKSSAAGSAAGTGSDAAGEKAPVKRTARFRGPIEPKTQTDANTATAPDAEDEDNDFPGKVKSVDTAKRLLVVTLLNGHDRSFILAKDVTIIVNGRASKAGLSDAALRPGASLTVITEAGGRKVKELKVAPATTRKLLRKAG